MTPAPFPVINDDGRRGTARTAGLNGTYRVVEITTSDGTTERVEMHQMNDDRGAVGWWFHDSGMWIQLGDHWVPSTNAR
jgi:hypothetical protein